MKRVVLADTGPLYAAVDPDDAHHKRARQQLDRLASGKHDVVILHSTLMEAYTLVLFRLGLHAATLWLEDAAKSALLNPTAEDYRQAIEKIQRFADQPITLFDAVLAAVAKRLDLAVWTFDHHFEVMKIEVWR